MAFDSNGIARSPKPISTNTVSLLKMLVKFFLFLSYVYAEIGSLFLNAARVGKCKPAIENQVHKADIIDGQGFASNFPLSAPGKQAFRVKIKSPEIYCNYTMGHKSGQ